MSITRREVLMRVGAVGGAGATLAAMELIGLTAATPTSATQFALPPGSGRGKSVVVLGAGIAGLVAAYELKLAGYAVTVIEARDRIGGRVWTVRDSDRIEHFGRAPQKVSLSPGLYFNAGAARIPSSHHAILGYARRLGVPLEAFVNSSRATGWDFDGKVVTGRQMLNDLNGRIGELLAKAIDVHALDAAMPKDELGAFRAFLAAYAGLDENGTLTSQPSSGFSDWPGGYDDPGAALPPLTLKELLPSRAVRLPYVFEQILDMQPTLLQPVGGMDRIAEALHREVKPSVRLGQPVSAIRREGHRVRIEHRGTATRADYCVCTLPAHLLARVPNDFSAAKQAALKDVPYLKSAKLAFEAPRFWEMDDQIYGGLAWTDRLNENLIYPSDRFNSPRGILVAAYVGGWTHDDTPDSFCKLPFHEQIRISQESVEALHPGKSRLLERPMVTNWGQIAFSEGVGAVGPEWGPQRRGQRYAELLKPEGPIFFAGEHLSYVGLWQEGAALSAHEAIKRLQAMVAEKGSAAA